VVDQGCILPRSQSQSTSCRLFHLPAKRSPYKNDLLERYVSLPSDFPIRPITVVEHNACFAKQDISLLKLDFTPHVLTFSSHKTTTTRSMVVYIHSRIMQEVFVVQMVQGKEHPRKVGDNVGPRPLHYKMHCDCHSELRLYL
jgi:hypothetical protein